MPKSYSGCLRCRRQKIKCDQGTPSCENCLSSRTTCKYATNLRWSKDDRNVLRRPVEKARFPANMQFNPGKVHEILDTLDKVHQTSDACLGPFTVFEVPELLPSAQYLSRDQNVDKEQSQSTPPHTQFSEVRGCTEHVQEYSSPTNMSIPLSEGAPTIFDGFSETSPNTERNQPTTELDHAELFREDLLNCFCEDFTSNTPEQDAEVLLFERTVECNWPISQAAKNMSFSIMRLTTMAQGLLVYTTRIFTPDNSVRASSGNLWCTFFTPPALAAVGEILATGSTTSAKYAILCAVLSCGAHRARQNFRSDSLEATFCISLGKRLYDGGRYWIGRWLKDQPLEKYKDGLVALITLMMNQFITEDKVRREKTMCVLQRVVNKRLKERPEVSTKVSILHKAAAMPILLSWVATGRPKNHDNDPIDSSRWIDFAYEDTFPTYEETFSCISSRLVRLDSRQAMLIHLQEPNQIQSYIEQYICDIPREAYDKGSNKNQFSYGLPPSIIFLFKEAVMISEMFDNGESNPTSEFIWRSTLLEAALANWERAYEPPIITIPIGENSPAAMEARWSAISSHNTLAFYDGVVLFHYCINKGVDNCLLQNTVRRVIDNLESITCLNMELRERITVPILFPGFVGACLAMEPDSALCSRYDSWLNDMDTFSIYPRRNLLRVVTELRRQRVRGEPCKWSTIAREQHITPNMF